MRTLLIVGLSIYYDYIQHAKNSIIDLNLPFTEAKIIHPTFSQNEKYDLKMMVEMNESF